MQGLGDNIYQRAILREIAGTRPLYLMTPWPQIYNDLPIWCLPWANSRLRTQNKNMARDDLAWAKWPRFMPPAKTFHYVNRPHTTILQALSESAGVVLDQITFDLPSFRTETIDRPYIVIRPATVRKEWRAIGRNPRPEYLAQAAEYLRDYFHIISVADLSEGQEWLVPPIPYADETYHAGELSFEGLMALVEGASGIVGGVGWQVPAAIAYRVPMLLIFGGWGVPNGPQRIFDRSARYLAGSDQAIPPGFLHVQRPGPQLRQANPRYRRTDRADGLWDSWRADRLQWLPEHGIGWYPVTANPYGDGYWMNYRKLDDTPIGAEAYCYARRDGQALHEGDCG